MAPYSSNRKDQRSPQIERTDPSFHVPGTSNSIWRKKGQAYHAFDKLREISYDVHSYLLKIAFVEKRDGLGSGNGHTRI